MRTSNLAALGAALASFGCSPPVHHAHLDHASGIVQGAPVTVAGVRVGRVESLRVVESRVDVGFVFEGDHQVTLRADSCAMASAGDPGATLVIVPGEQAPLATEHPLPQCQMVPDALEDVMGSFGQGLEGMMRAIQEQAQAAAAGQDTEQAQEAARQAAQLLQGAPQPGAAQPANAPPQADAPPPFAPTFPAP